MSHDDALDGLTSSRPPVVRASDGEWYILPLVLAAYRAGRLKRNTFPVEALTRPEPYDSYQNLQEVHAFHRRMVTSARAARPKRRKKYGEDSEIGKLLKQL